MACTSHDVISLCRNSLVMFLIPSSDIIISTTLAQFPDEQTSSSTATQGVDGSPISETEVVESPFGGGNFFTFLMLLLVGMIVFKELNRIIYLKRSKNIIFYRE